MLTARGKTKYLVDSSQQETNTTMLRPTNKAAFEKLLEPFRIQLEWMATTLEIDKIRWRDGSKVIEEINRLCTEHGHYAYETRDGKLRVTDDIGPGTGEPLVLGDNIVSFSAEQSEEDAKSEITVKGQRTPKDVWGEDAIVKPVKYVTDEWVQSYIPIVVQHFGDGTPEALERRGQFEANKRSAMSKRLSVEVFHVQSRSGEPWDIGTLHYVEVPPEGIFDVFECTAITYTVDAKGTLKTDLTLSPPPTNSAGKGGGLQAFASTGGAELLADGASRRSLLGVTFAPGSYPQPWSGPVLAIQGVAGVVGRLAGAVAAGLQAFAGANSDTPPPPLQLPEE